MRQAIAIRPNAALTHTTLGLVLFRQMRPADAIASFSSALACGHPDPGEVWDKIGLAFLQMQRVDAASTVFRRRWHIIPGPLNI